MQSGGRGLGDEDCFAYAKKQKRVASFRKTPNPTSLVFISPLPQHTSVQKARSGFLALEAPARTEEPGGPTVHGVAKTHTRLSTHTQYAEIVSSILI